MRVSVIVLVLLMLTIHLALTKPSKPKHRGVRIKPAKTKYASNAVDAETCAEVCTFWSCTYYYCPEGYVCCTPGSPESLCCPYDKPECLEEGCCPTGYTEVCGDKCCTEDSACCKDIDNCCETEEGCCNSEECCDEESPCCTGEDESVCCEQETMACCGEPYGCTNPCPSQFETVSCTEQLIEEVNIICPNRIETRKLYRATYPGQTCQGGGLLSKDPSAEKTVSSHVGCGSRKGYKSQYISFSTSKEVVLGKYWPNAQPGSRIVEVDIDRLPPGCRTYDLTLAMNRGKWLGHNKWAMAYTINDCEVLLACESRVPCKTIIGPKAGEEEVEGVKVEGGKEGDGVEPQDKREEL